MTEPPPEPREPPTMDDELADPWHDQLVEISDDYGAPDVQAVVAIVLAVLALYGFGLLSGTTYVFTALPGPESIKTRNVLAALLSAAFALIPVIVGWRASARVLASDPRWIATLARAAVVLGLLALVLRLVLAIVAAGTADPRTSLGI